jgi:hypothetical protein
MITDKFEKWWITYKYIAIAIWLIVTLLVIIFAKEFATYSIWTYLTILGLAFAQNTSFSIVSRSRNRDNIKYHIISAIFSNGVWFLTFRALIQKDMDLLLFIPYCIGTVAGSVYGVKISMWIEQKLGAESDSHIKRTNTFTGLLVNSTGNSYEVRNGLIVSELKAD